jgi:hypothetical protein
LTILSKKTNRKLSNAKQIQPAPDGDPSSVLAELRERKEAVLADRVQLQTEIIRGDLVLREIVTSATGNIYALWRRQFLELDLSLGDTLCAVTGIPEKEGHKVRKIISDSAYGAIKEIMEKITAFVEQN